MSFGSAFGDTLAGGFRNDVFGTSDQAAAAQDAAMQQQAMAKQQQSQAMDLSKMTPQELQAYGGSLTAASSQLAQQQRLMDSIDPAVMEASKQVLKVLQGGQTGMGDAIGQQRNSQRAALVNSLQSQYGPGAESSSIGQKALSQFDMQTNMMQQQGQGQTLGNLMGVMDNKPNANGAISALNNAGQQFGNVQNRQLAAAFGTNPAMLNSAGADRTGDLIKAGAQRQFFDNWSNSSMKFGEMMGGSGMGQSSGGGGGGGGGGGSNPTSGMQGSQEGNFKQPQLGDSYGFGGQGSGGTDWNYGARM